MFSWGENTRYGFGFVKPNSLEKSTDTGVDFTPIEITHLSAGNTAIAFIRDDGKVSLVRMQTQNGNTITGKPKRIECKNIQAVCCGDSSVLLLSIDGKVFSINLKESSVPRLLDNFNNRRVTQVACGDHHSIALTQDGLVFTWGQSSSGQLGLGKIESSIVRSPQPLKSLSGIPLAQISAGGDHSFALSISGAVFGWGQNSAGQLGLGDKTDRHTPVPVDCMGLKKTVSISCGEKHTAILTKGGLVFTSGSGCYGQLGHNSLRDELRPRLVAELWGTKVTQIACGRHHTLAFVGSSEKIYSFGCGEQGQLGNGVKTVQSVPLPLQLPLDGKDDKHVLRIFAGGNQSIALCPIAQESEKEVISPISTVNMIETLDKGTIEMWLSQCQIANSWKKIQRDIKCVFSSASCLNGSFLDTSHDKHYQTSMKCSGLDLSLARIAFEKLATKDKVLNEIEGVVRCSLLPSLSKEPTGVEGLRVYLILPELLRVLVERNRGSQLTVAVAEAILSLHPDKLQVLEGLWSRMPYSYLRSAVKAFQCVPAKSIKQYTDDKSLMSTLGVLQKLYFVNSKSPRRLSDKVFHMNIVKIFFERIQLLEKAQLRMDFLWPDDESHFQDYSQILKVKKLCKDRLSLLMKYPCILDTEAKYALWVFEMANIEARYLEDLGILFRNYMIVGRKTLLQDTFRCLRENSCYLEVPIKVKFKEEDGADYGGVSMEFFTLLAKELINSEPQILSVNEDGMAWFTQDERNVTDECYLLGVLCGMALNNRCLLNVRFPMGLFKKLLGLRPGLDDLRDMSPTEAQGLKQLLNYEEEVVEAMELDFGWSRGQELLPNGVIIPVTKVNRQKYVDLYVDMVFNKSVRHQFEEFERGFLEGCPSEAWRMFHPDELMTLLHGDEKFEWKELRENAKYQGYMSTDEVIQNFWVVFTEFSEEQKKSFLSFLTGTERLPRARLSRLRVTIKALPKPDPDEHYPEAETCFETLQLPSYSSVHVLRDKLVHAITYCDVIGKT